MIRHILFDMGNTLIRFDPEHFIRRLGIEAEADRQALLTELFRSVEWVRLDRGTLTEEQVIESVCRRLPEHLHDAAGKLVSFWDRPLLTIDGMEELCGELAALGYGLYLLTNAGPRHREYWPRFPVSRYFPEERVFRSADYHLLKPEHEFYETALSTLGLEAGECFFIDDAPANIEGALRCGISGAVFHGVGPLRTELRARGVPVREA